MFVQSGKTKIHCRLFTPSGDEFGADPSSMEAPWVTLINGHTRSSKDFQGMGKYLAQRGYRVLAMDNRGSGETVYSGEFDLSDLAADVESCWRELKVSSSHVLGISMGGVIAQILASRLSDPIRSLCLVSTISSKSYFTGAREWPDTLEDVRELLDTYFSEKFRESNAPLVQAMAKQVHAKITDGSFLEDSRNQRMAMARFSFDHDLGAIQAPTLVIHGEKDGIVDPESARQFERQISNCRCTVYTGVGHLILAEAQKRFYQDYFGFLDELRRH